MFPQVAFQFRLDFCNCTVLSRTGTGGRTTIRVKCYCERDFSFFVFCRPEKGSFVQAQAQSPVRAISDNMSVLIGVEAVAAGEGNIPDVQNSSRLKEDRKSSTRDSVRGEPLGRAELPEPSAARSALTISSTSRRSAFTDAFLLKERIIIFFARPISPTYFLDMRQIAGYPLFQRNLAPFTYSATYLSLERWRILGFWHMAGKILERRGARRSYRSFSEKCIRESAAAPGAGDRQRLSAADGSGVLVPKRFARTDLWSMTFNLSCSRENFARLECSFARLTVAFLPIGQHIVEMARKGLRPHLNEASLFRLPVCFTENEKSRSR